MDIVKWLRTTDLHSYDGSIVYEEGKKAANEIERLREALIEIADKESWLCCSVSRAMKGIACSAIVKATGGE